MKTKILIAVLFVFSSLSSRAFGNQETRESKQFDIKGFSGLVIENNFELIVEQSDAFDVKIIALETQFDNLEVYKESGNLHIDYKKSFWETESLKGKMKKITIHIKMPKLDYLALDGSLKANIRNFESKHMEVNLDGSAKCYMKLNVENLSLNINGASVIELLGTAENLDIEMNGAGILRAEYFMTKNCNVDLEGAGICSIFVTEVLEPKLTGAGTIKYKGEPKIIDKDIDGLGRLKSID